MEYLKSILIGISIAAIPGPVFFELVRRTLTKGFWPGSLLSVGEFLGNFIFLLLIFFGLGNFLSQEMFKIILYLLGALILFWIGFKALKIKIESIENACSGKSFSDNSVVTGFIMSISSPFVVALWVSLAGSYLNQFATKFLSFINIFLIAFGFLIFYFSLAGIVNYTRHKISSQYLVWLSKASGAILIIYGGSFIFEIFKHL